MFGRLCVCVCMCEWMCLSEHSTQARITTWLILCLRDRAFFFLTHQMKLPSSFLFPSLPSILRNSFLVSVSCKRSTHIHAAVVYRTPSNKSIHPQNGKTENHKKELPKRNDASIKTAKRSNISHNHCKEITHAHIKPHQKYTFSKICFDAIRIKIAAKYCE